MTGAGGRGPGAGLFAVLCVLAGCGRYGDFTLPVLGGGDPHLTYTWEAQPKPVLERANG